jgi:hypothetical protein
MTLNVKNVLTKKHFAVICILLATSFTSLAEELDSQSKPTRLDSNRVTLNSPVATFTLKDFKASRILHDTDGDGWCDHWCSLFPKNPKIVGRDSDGDGMTDYEEMILMQDPDVINPLPRKLTARELMEQERDRKIKRNQNANRLQTKHRKIIEEGLHNMRLAQVTKLTPVPTRQKKDKDARDFARILKDLYNPDPKRKGAKSKTLQDLKPNQYIPFSYPALMTKADHLWPGGSFPYHDATGADPTSGSPLAPIGIWELGKIKEPYPTGYNGRIFFGTSQTFVVRGVPHATEVAQVLAHPGPDFNSRGIAYEAKLKFYNFDNDYPEMAAEAAGIVPLSNTDPTLLKMKFSNHSYGEPAGWIERYDDVHGQFINWLGPNFAGKDPEFGAYTWKSKTIDTIAYHAQTYLPVYAAGNDAADQRLINSSASYGLGVNYVDPNDSANRSSLFHPHDGGPAVVATPPLPTPDDMSYVLGEQSGTQNGVDSVLGLAFDTIPSTACAKNNITVGAVYGSRDGENIPEFINLSHFSSRGPIDDGRVKPDLVGPAAITAPPSEAIGIGGTSYAAPAVTGTLALLEEINHDNGGPSRLASTWKALVLNTAIDCTKISFLNEVDNGLPEEARANVWARVIPSHLGPVADSVTLTGPDYFYGWGLIDADAAADLLIKDLQSGESSNHLCEHYLTDPSNDAIDDNNLEIEIPITHDGTSPSMRIMLCWTDPPYQDLVEEKVTVGAVNPEVLPSTPDDDTPRLVNNLDLWVVDPNGVTKHRPWVLNHLTPLVPAGRGENNRDNVEQVIIDTPIPGTYTIVVSHKGTLKASELVSGTLDLLSDNDPLTAPIYRHVSGREQAFFLAISGNLGPTPIGPTLTILNPIPQGANQQSTTFFVSGFTGLRYCLQGSHTLEPDDWYDHPGTTFTLPSEAPHPLTVTHTALSHRFYRVKEIAPETD